MRALIFLGLLLYGPICSAQYVTGSDLVRQLQEVDKWVQHTPLQVADQYQVGLGIGYIDGVIDALPRGLCVPNTVTRAQLGAVVRKYLIAHPENWNWSGASLIFLAVTEAFPCPKSSPPK